jgi:23S rRNA pseudouridine1911/1915/1917 synthase
MELPDSFEVPVNASPDRADRMLSDLLPGTTSRAFVARLIRQGRVELDGQIIKPATILSPGDRVAILPRSEEPSRTRDVEIPDIGIIYEDRDLVVVDKPAGLAVHPGAGRASGTLADELARDRPEMVGVGEAGRWGIVHRLDKDTSGVMVVAKTQLALTNLSSRFKEHSIHRVYLALVRGNPGLSEGVVDAPLGRHTRDRKRMTTATGGGRRAVTRWRVLERYGELTLVEIMPETGRTHQIRVHLASVGMPVAGDRVYGRLRKKGGMKAPASLKAIAIFDRQALHASVLGFDHPRDERHLEFASPLAPDIQEAIGLLGGES